MTFSRASIARQIERKQEEIMRYKKIAPSEYLQLIRRLEHNGQQNGPKANRLSHTPEQQLDMMCGAFNEKPYRRDSAAIDFCMNPTISKYDKVYLMQRFPNLLFLCQEYFASELNGKNIYLSSLPLSLVNGICEQVSAEDFIIYLSEGILYAAPNLVKSFNQIDINNLKTIHERGDFQLDRKTERFADVLGAYVTDAISPMLANIKDHHHMVSAFETWKFGELLRQNIAQKVKMDESSMTQVFRKDTGGKQRNYYMFRGFLLFILAHEVSHAARGHNIMRAEETSLLDQNYIETYLEAVRSLKPENKDLHLDSETYYAFHQLHPLEMQADGDAFAILLKYSNDHRLAAHQRKALIEGAVFCILTMEFIYQLKIVSTKGIGEMMRIGSMDPLERNVLMNLEHPWPSSRIEFAISSSEDITPEFEMEITLIAQETWEKGDLLWRLLSGMFFQAIEKKKIQPSAMFGANFRQLFDTAPAMGHMSL